MRAKRERGGSSQRRPRPRGRAPRSQPKVVLDNNLFVAAYWNPRSASARVIEACREGQLALAVSAAIRREIMRTLRQIRANDDYRRGVSSLLAAGEHAETRESPAATVPADPDDEKYVECALAASADYVVSSDRHLLALGNVRGVEMISPSALARRLGL